MKNNKKKKSEQINFKSFFGKFFIILLTLTMIAFYIIGMFNI